MLPAETVREIEIWVRGGFFDRDEIVEAFHEMADGADPGEIEAAVAAAVARHESDKSAWPAVTDCDRLSSVFEALNGRGVIALENAGYTQSDGYADVAEALEEDSLGYCFYHQQDLERAVSGEGLWLAFGAVESDRGEADGVRVGRIVVDELRRGGFDVEWDGTLARRIHIPRIDWRRR